MQKQTQFEHQMEISKSCTSYVMNILQYKKLLNILIIVHNLQVRILVKKTRKLNMNPSFFTAVGEIISRKIRTLSTSCSCT